MIKASWPVSQRALRLSSFYLGICLSSFDLFLIFNLLLFISQLRGLFFSDCLIVTVLKISIGNYYLVDDYYVLSIFLIEGFLNVLHGKRLYNPSVRCIC